MIVSAHQPNFIPYLGFFDKMNKSDIFIIRDEVQYVHHEYHNRNRIRINGNSEGVLHSKWLNVPVKKSSDYIMNIKIRKDVRKKRNILWNKQILHDLKANYSTAPYFEKYYPDIVDIFDNSDDYLADLNMKIINFLTKTFNIKAKIIMASELGLKPTDSYTKSNPSKSLAYLSESFNAKIYLSGSGGKNYLNLRPFEKRNIKVEFQEFSHPTYNQPYPGFLPNMSSFDALFCNGNKIFSKPLEVKQIV